MASSFLRPAETARSKLAMLAQAMSSTSAAAHSSASRIGRELAAKLVVSRATPAVQRWSGYGSDEYTVVICARALSNDTSGFSLA